MKVTQRVPARGEVDLAEVLDGLTAAPPGQPGAGSKRPSVRSR